MQKLPFFWLVLHPRKMAKHIYIFDFTAEINKKRLKMNKKHMVLSTPQSWSTP